VRAPRGARDLEEALRAELAAIEPQRACCRAAERSGLGAAASGRARTPDVARLAVRLAGDAGPTTPEVPRRATVEWDETDWASAMEHCRIAWLRGRFLAAASMSVSGPRTHVEFVVSREAAPALARRLAEAGFPAAWRQRRGRGVVTWKSMETVLAFLRAAGASTSVLRIESRLVTRQLRGHLNRVLNAETANLARSVASAARQLAAIDSLERDGRLSRMPGTERIVAAARRDAPEASLGELAATLKLSRARVQRALERLVREATSGAPPDLAAPGPAAPARGAAVQAAPRPSAASR
jgi:hypothetical protein